MEFEFRTSRACSEGCGGACVQVATNLAGNDVIALRDSKTGTVMTFDRQEWTDFTVGVRAGEFDV